MGQNILDMIYFYIIYSTYIYADLVSVIKKILKEKINQKLKTLFMHKKKIIKTFTISLSSHKFFLFQLKNFL